MVARAIFANLSINHSMAANEVIQSNWSKFPDFDKKYNPAEGTPPREEIEATGIIHQGRYGNITYEVREGKVIYWAGLDNGKPVKKYVKPSTFREANFENCLAFRQD